MADTILNSKRVEVLETPGFTALDDGVIIGADEEVRGCRDGGGDVEETESSIAFTLDDPNLILILDARADVLDKSPRCFRTSLSSSLVSWSTKPRLTPEGSSLNSYWLKISFARLKELSFMLKSFFVGDVAGSAAPIAFLDCGDKECGCMLEGKVVREMFDPESTVNKDEYCRTGDEGALLESFLMKEGGTSSSSSSSAAASTEGRSYDTGSRS